MIALPWRRIHARWRSLSGSCSPPWPAGAPASARRTGRDWAARGPRRRRGRQGDRGRDGEARPPDPRRRHHGQDGQEGPVGDRRHRRRQVEHRRRGAGLCRPQGRDQPPQRGRPPRPVEVKLERAAPGRGRRRACWRPSTRATRPTRPGATRKRARSTRRCWPCGPTWPRRSTSRSRAATARKAATRRQWSTCEGPRRRSRRTGLRLLMAQEALEGGIIDRGLELLKGRGRERRSRIPTSTSTWPRILLNQQKTEERSAISAGRSPSIPRTWTATSSAASPTSGSAGWRRPKPTSRRWSSWPRLGPGGHRAEGPRPDQVGPRRSDMAVRRFPSRLAGLMAALSLAAGVRAAPQIQITAPGHERRLRPIRPRATGGGE